MKLKGTYSPSVMYDVGDAVKYTDGNVYHLRKPAVAGTAPTDTRYWSQVDQQQKEAALMALDVLEIAEDALEDAQGDLTDAIEALEERVAALEPESEPEEETT